jgi:hypothetical protein
VKQIFRFAVDDSRERCVMGITEELGHANPFVLTIMKITKNVEPRAFRHATLREAEARLPLEKVIELYGYGPKNGNWKFFRCPFCQKRNKAGVFTAPNGTRMFRCQSASCPTGSKALPVLQFIRQIEGLASNREAFEAYLKQAGIWKEPTTVQQPVSSDSPLAALRFLYDQTIPTDEDAERTGQRGITLEFSKTPDLPIWAI